MRARHHLHLELPSNRLPEGSKSTAAIRVCPAQSPSRAGEEEARGKGGDAGEIGFAPIARGDDVGTKKEHGV
jgi:hypothetical protein